MNWSTLDLLVLNGRAFAQVYVAVHIIYHLYYFFTVIRGRIPNFYAFLSAWASQLVLNLDDATNFNNLVLLGFKFINSILSGLHVSRWCFSWTIILGCNIFNNFKPLSLIHDVSIVHYLFFSRSELILNLNKTPSINLIVFKCLNFSSSILCRLHISRRTLWCNIVFGSYVFHLFSSILRAGLFHNRLRFWFQEHLIINIKCFWITILLYFNWSNNFDNWLSELNLR